MLEERLGDVETKCFCSFEVDDKFKLGRQLHRQITRLGALQNTTDVRSRLPVAVQQVNSVGNKAATDGEDPIRIDCRKAVPSRERDY